MNVVLLILDVLDTGNSIADINNSTFIILSSKTPSIKCKNKLVIPNIRVFTTTAMIIRCIIKKKNRSTTILDAEIYKTKCAYNVETPTLARHLEI